MESAGIARLEDHLKATDPASTHARSPRAPAPAFALNATPRPPQGMSMNKDGEGGDGINDDEDAYYLYTAVQWAVSQGPGVPSIDE